LSLNHNFLFTYWLYISTAMAVIQKYVNLLSVLGQVGRFVRW
jgi:hypothetical protein